MKTFAMSPLRPAALVTLFLFTTGGTPTNGIPTNGIPTNGIPTSGIPTSAAHLEALERSLVFANKAVHEALISRPFTQLEMNPREPCSAP